MHRFIIAILLITISLSSFADFKQSSKVHKQYYNLLMVLGGANFVADVMCDKYSGKALTTSIRETYNQENIVSCIRVDNMKKIIHKDLMKILPSPIIKVDGIFINFTYLDFANHDFESNDDYYLATERDQNPTKLLDKSLKRDDYISKTTKKYLNLLAQIKGVRSLYKGYCNIYDDEYSYFKAEGFEKCVFIILKNAKDYIDIYRVLKKDTINLDQINFHFILNNL